MTIATLVSRFASLFLSSIFEEEAKKIVEADV